MITVISNDKNNLEFRIGDLYRVFLNKRFGGFKIFNLHLDAKEVFRSNLTQRNVNRMPFLLYYLEKMSLRMEGNDIDHRILRIMLLALNEVEYND